MNKAITYLAIPLIFFCAFMQIREYRTCSYLRQQQVFNAHILNNYQLLFEPAEQYESPYILKGSEATLLANGLVDKVINGETERHYPYFKTHKLKVYSASMVSIVLLLEGYNDHFKSLPESLAGETRYEAMMLNLRTKLTEKINLQLDSLYYQKASQYLISNLETLTTMLSWIHWENVYHKRFHSAEELLNINLLSKEFFSDSTLSYELKKIIDEVNVKDFNNETSVKHLIMSTRSIYRNLSALANDSQKMRLISIKKQYAKKFSRRINEANKELLVCTAEKYWKRISYAIKDGNAFSRSDIDALLKELFSGCALSEDNLKLSRHAHLKTSNDTLKLVIDAFSTAERENLKTLFIDEFEKKRKAFITRGLTTLAEDYVPKIKPMHYLFIRPAQTDVINGTKSNDLIKGIRAFDNRFANNHMTTIEQFKLWQSHGVELDCKQIFNKRLDQELDCKINATLSKMADGIAKSIVDSSNPENQTIESIATDLINEDKTLTPEFLQYLILTTPVAIAKSPAKDTTATQLPHSILIELLACINSKAKLKQMFIECLSESLKREYREKLANDSSKVIEGLIVKIYPIPKEHDFACGELRNKSYFVANQLATALKKNTGQSSALANIKSGPGSVYMEVKLEMAPLLKVYNSVLNETKQIGINNFPDLIGIRRYYSNSDLFEALVFGVRDRLSAGFG